MEQHPVLSPTPTLNCRGRLLTLERPLVMGIINATPDSFFSGSRAENVSQAVEKAGQMLKDGATLLDVGGYSSRPGAEDISEQEEMDRLLPVVEALTKCCPDALLSIDTFRPQVARAALSAGGHLINDITGGENPAMLSLCAEHSAPLILMHMQGNPKTMQIDPKYDDVLLDVLKWMSLRIDRARKAGVADVVVDPGFGFGKTMEHNYRLLKHLRQFSHLGCPIMAGISRKSLVTRVLGVKAAEALNGTTALHALALAQGAAILRVHDVKEAYETVTLLLQYRETV